MQMLGAIVALTEITSSASRLLATIAHAVRERLVKRKQVLLPGTLPRKQFFCPFWIARDFQDALHGLSTSSGGAAVRDSSAADHRIFAAVCSACATLVQRRHACVRQSGPRPPLSGELSEKLSGRGGRARAVASSKR